MLHPLPAAAASAAADTDCNQAAHQTAMTKKAAHQTAMTKKAAHQTATKLAVSTVSKLPPAMLPLPEGPALAKIELPPAMLPLPEGPALAKIELPPAMLPLPEGPALAKAELFDVPLDVGSKPYGKRSRRLVNLPGQPFLADSQFPQQPHHGQASTSPR